jgi:membrane protein YdbS with pleckstrin-like domain
MSDETVVWKGRPSQLLNFVPFTLCIVIDLALIGGAFVAPFLLLLTIFPLIYLVWSYLKVHCRVFELTSQRLRMYEGVLNQEIDEVELYRVKDTGIARPFLQRIFGLSTITLVTSDRTHSEVVIPAIKEGMEVREKIRSHVEVVRDSKRVREVDFDSTDDDFGDEIG